MAERRTGGEVVLVARSGPARRARPQGAAVRSSEGATGDAGAGASEVSGSRPRYSFLWLDWQRGMRSLLRRARRFEPGLRWLLACAVLVTPVGSAAQGLPGGTRLVYTRAPGTEMCLDEEGFRDLVASHLPGGIDPFVPDGVWLMKVAVARRERGFRGELALFDGDGRPRGGNVYTRATCAELMEDVGVMVGLALLPPPQSITPTPQPAHEAPPTAAAALSTPATLDSAPTTPATPTATAGKPEPTREGPPQARPTPKPRASGPSAQNAGAARSQTPAGSPAARPQLTLGLGPSLAFGFLPASSVGLIGFAGVRWPATSLLVELRGDLPVTAEPSEGVSIETSWFGGSLAGCQHVNALFACGLATAGRVERVTNGAPWIAAARYLGLGLRAGLEVPLSARLAGQVAGDVLLTVDAPRLELDTPPVKPDRQEVWSAAPLSAVVSLRLVASF
jgi:hypothetical protein